MARGQVIVDGGVRPGGGRVFEHSGVYYELCENSRRVALALGLGPSQRCRLRTCRTCPAKGDAARRRGPRLDCCSDHCGGSVISAGGDEGSRAATHWHCFYAASPGSEIEYALPGPSGAVKHRRRAVIDVSDWKDSRKGGGVARSGWRIGVGARVAGEGHRPARHARAGYRVASDCYVYVSRLFLATWTLFVPVVHHRHRPR